MKQVSSGIPKQESRKKKRRIPIDPNLHVAVGFLFVILVGTALLMLPQALMPGKPAAFLTAFFTATSAVCVTGLTVVDVGTHFTFFGQLVVLGLIEIGGLGIMMFGTIIMLMVGEKLSVKNESAMMSMYGMDSVRSIPSLIRRGISLFILFQTAGAAVLIWSSLRSGFSLEKAVYHGVFHSISAFCNAGFALYPDNLCSFRHNPVYLLTISTLIVSGGLGFLVLRNLSVIKFWRRDLRLRGKVSLHTKMVLLATLILIVAGTIGFWTAESNGILKDQSIPDKLVISLFQAITPRTAGFNVVDMSDLSEYAKFQTMILMFIGGSPGSMAGGIKTTTLAVVILTLFALLRGRLEIEWRNRTIPMQTVRYALAIFFLYIVFTFTSYSLLLITEPITAGTDKAMRLLFETISAFGTVGLSLDTTPELTQTGQLIIIASMFIGRVGPLTLVMLLGSRGISQRVRYPEEDITIG